MLFGSLISSILGLRFGGLAVVFTTTQHPQEQTQNLEAPKLLNSRLGFKDIRPYIWGQTLPFLGVPAVPITDPNHETRYPQNGVWYDPQGRVSLGFTDQSPQTGKLLTVEARKLEHH